MQGIFYLWKTQFKNQLKNLRNHPARGLLYLFLTVMLCFSLGVTMFSPAQESLDTIRRDPRELGALLAVLFFFLLSSQITKGIASGGSFFSVADVNLLFQSPTSPKTILYYGLVRQAGTTLLIGFFLLFQAPNLHNFYGVSIGASVCIFLGYCLVAFLGEILSVWLYSFISGNSRRKTAVQSVQYGLMAVLTAAVLLRFLQTTQLLPSAIAVLDGPIMMFLPLAGWAKIMIFGLLSGNFLLFFLFLSLNLLLGGGLIFLISRSDADYYEDVLQATEKNYAVKEAAKDGKILDAKPVEKIKMKKTGIGRGRGASVLFFKHLLENRRANSFFLDTATLMMAGIAIAACLVVGREHLSLVYIFAFLTYMQLILSSMGRWVKELAYPFIYLIPQNPLKKLLWAMLESLEGSLFSGLLIFLPCGLILGTPLLEIGGFILARVSFACVFSAGNILIERLFGNVRNKGLILMFYFLSLLLIILPGIIAMIVLNLTLSAMLPGLLASAAWNLLAAFLVLLCCKDILHNMEMNTL